MAGKFPARILTILSPLPRQRVVDRYAIAISAAVLAILLRWLLDPVLGHVAFYVTLYVAVTFSAVVCGFAPAILSGLLGFLGIFYWFVDPRHSLSFIRQSPEIHAIVGCFLVCAVLIALGEANRRKQLRLNESIDALTTEARERRRAEDALRQAHDELEHRVKERTVELSQVLTRLESEIRVREKKEDELRNLSLRLMTLQDEERRRIARELHDSAGQTLAAMKMSIALIRQIEATPDLARLVDDLNTLADEALQEVRTTSYLLHPPLLDEAGISSAARWFIEGFARRSGIQVHCEIPEQMERFPRECELVLFRVLQESLTNVHRHSGASTASVRLNRDTDHLELVISDNGKGIPEECLLRFNASVGTGVGITGMRERVRELGGYLEIRSLKTGTAISVSLPALKSSIAPGLAAQSISR